MDKPATKMKRVVTGTIAAGGHGYGAAIPSGGNGLNHPFVGVAVGIAKGIYAVPQAAFQ